MKKARFAVALAMLACSCATIPASTPEAPLTAAYVKQHLRELHGQTVRVRGEIDDCKRCSICDGPAETDVCLAVSFGDPSPEEHRLLAELYRFATITIEAQVDARCMLGYDPGLYASSETAEETWVCTPVKEVFEDVRVLSIESRKPATLGRFHEYSTSQPLQPLSDDEHRTIRHALNELIGFPEDALLAAFLDPDDEQDNPARQSFIVCTCQTEECGSQWPTTSGQAWARSPANPYYCQSFTRIGSNWIISP